MQSPIALCSKICSNRHLLHTCVPLADCTDMAGFDGASEGFELILPRSKASSFSKMSLYHFILMDCGWHSIRYLAKDSKATCLLKVELHILFFPNHVAGIAWRAWKSSNNLKMAVKAWSTFCICRKTKQVLGTGKKLTPVKCEANLQDLNHSSKCPWSLRLTRTIEPVHMLVPCCIL